MVSVPYSFREAAIDDISLIKQWTNDLMVHEALDKNTELPLADDIEQLIEDWLMNLITDNNSLIIIASDEATNPPLNLGFIVGLLQLQPNNFTQFNMHGVIQMLWVDPKQRKKNLASQLLIHMEDTFKNLKVPYCDIQYSDTNKEAEAFWDKAGYTKVSHSCRKIFE